MSVRNTLRLTALAVMASSLLQSLSLPALAEPKASKQIDIQASETAVKEIMRTFNRAEEALKARDLEALMPLYSKNYHYHGITRSKLKETWKDIFGRYRRVASHHIFSRIVVTTGSGAPRASITCTGGLWATSETTGERIIIDSWFDAVHTLVYEDGAWRILGHDGEDNTEFGIAHPFF